MKGCFDDLIKQAQSLEDLGNLIKEAEKAEEDSGLVQFGDLEIGKWFEHDGEIYIKNSEHHARYSGAGGCLWNFEPDFLVRPIEVEIRKKVPGEVLIEIDSGDVCCVLSCDNCPVGGEDGCHCHDYTWTLTATPKKG